MILVVVCVVGREQEDLGVDVLEHLFQLVLVPDPDHALEATRERGIDHVAERIAVLGRIDDERVDVADLMLMPEREQWQMCAASQAVVTPPDDESLRALRLSSARASAIGYLDEHGDSVAFCDCLAQPSCARHGS